MIGQGSGLPLDTQGTRTSATRGTPQSSRPSGVNHTSRNTRMIGDHVEALLGWFIYLTSQYDFKFGERVHGIIDMLNQASFSAWVLGTFSHRASVQRVGVRSRNGTHSAQPLARRESALGVATGSR